MYKGRSRNTICLISNCQVGVCNLLCKYAYNMAFFNIYHRGMHQIVNKSCVVFKQLHTRQQYTTNRIVYIDGPKFWFPYNRSDRPNPKLKRSRRSIFRSHTIVPIAQRQNRLRRQALVQALADCAHKSSILCHWHCSFFP